MPTAVLRGDVEIPAHVQAAAIRHITRRVTIGLLPHSELADMLDMLGLDAALDVAEVTA